MTPCRARWMLLAGALAAAPAGARAAGDLFTDPVDGAFDVDRFLASRYGFVPVVVPITEPAVGYGAAAGLVFLHGRLGGEEAEPGARRVPPSLSAAVGMYTSNGSWGAAAAHLGHWNGGDVRYLGAAAYTSLELSAYPGGQKVRFRLEAVPVVQDLTFRLFGSDLSAGARYTFAGTQMNVEQGAEAVESRDLKVVLSGLGPVLRWDGRDSIFSPNRGVRAEAAVTWYAPWLGSDRDGWKARVSEVSYGSLLPWLVAALRLDLQLSGGDLPFWFRPYVGLRGVPALRYQGQHVFVAETEERIDFTARWSAVLFGGVGAATAVPTPTLAWGLGTGFRYLLARQFGLRMGLDVARGPEDWAVYVIFGNAWN
ncbi:MAG TPA: hypothetical protein VLU43_00830 [Anaeromyxobacteraceae bacterium]|nr:hypothetical protein [Anaeromyxobacteraceae bacterium]